MARLKSKSKYDELQLKGTDDEKPRHRPMFLLGKSNSGTNMTGKTNSGTNIIESKVSTRTVTNTTKPSPPSSPTPNSPQEERIIKLLFKLFKKLEYELNKFNSRKYNNNKNAGALKSNILRTSLLPFLRKSQGVLDQYFDSESKVHKSLVSVIVAILLKWWSSLLGNLAASLDDTDSVESSNASLDPSSVHFSPVPASDRNAYLECISRIIARHDWDVVDDDFYKQYLHLLTKTLTYCIDKLANLKSLTLLVSAFIGKVFAHAFFHLPNVSNALLFLLNVKQSMFDASRKIVAHDPRHVNLLRQIFPLHLHQLIAFEGLAIKNRKKAYYVNCVPPPTHPVPGIKNPNGEWVHRWCNCDSNVFNSFFRHYIALIRKSLLPHVPADTYSEALVLMAPGFSVIYAHVLQIFRVSISRISSGNCYKLAVPTSKLSKEDRKQTPPPPPPPLLSINNYAMKRDIYYNSIIKIFRTVRDVVNAAVVDANMDYVTSSLVKLIDLALISIASETSIYDYNKNGLILNIVYEYINHVDNNMDCESLVNWEFWLSCNYIMIKNTDHIQILLKNFAFLFNIWDMIPECLSRYRDGEASLESLNKEWFLDYNESLKVNLINWLISTEVFQKFLPHWNPIVRSYYLRLLLWRIVGINNFLSSTLIQITKKVQANVDAAYDALCDFTNSLNESFDFKADNPLVNRRFGILAFGLKEDGLNVSDENGQEIMATTPLFKSSELRKTHPYEVFDEAIYSCTSLPLASSVSSSNAPTPSHSSLNLVQPNPKSTSKSIVSSLGKLFKYLALDEDEQNDDVIQAPVHPRLSKRASNRSLNNLVSNKATLRRNSVSMSSLSTAYSSVTSRSSSPSLLSFISTPTSLTDSASSSVKSDLESLPESTTTIINSHSSFEQLPELSKLPPEILRPAYKFDIVMDHDAMNEKYMLIQARNNGQPVTQSPSPTHRLHFPSRPRIPNISVYVNTDAYNSVYMNDEDGLYMECLLGKGSEEWSGEGGEKRLFSGTPSKITFTNLGRSLNELNNMIDEFKSFLNRKVESDQFNVDLSRAHNLNEFDYLKKIIPFLSVDSTNEAKLLNAN